MTFLGRTRRDGIDIDGRFEALKTPAAALSLFANASLVRTRVLDTPLLGYVPNVPDHVVNVGADFEMATIDAQRLSGSAYVTFVGRKFLSQDGASTTTPYQRATAKLAYAWPEGWTAFTQAIWYPGDRFSEIAINFGDTVSATPADIFVSAQPRLVVQGGLTYRFPATPTPAARI